MNDNHPPLAEPDEMFYRLFILDEDDNVMMPSVEVLASTDEEAQRKAGVLASGRASELWCFDRLVSRREAES